MLRSSRVPAPLPGVPCAHWHCPAFLVPAGQLRAVPTVRCGGHQNNPPSAPGQPRAEGWGLDPHLTLNLAPVLPGSDHPLVLVLLCPFHIHLERKTSEISAPQEPHLAQL